MKTYKCPRCSEEKEVNTQNFILGEERNDFQEDSEDFHIYVDAKNAYGDFVCRECVVDLVYRYLEMVR